MLDRLNHRLNVKSLVWDLMKAQETLGDGPRKTDRLK